MGQIISDLYNWIGPPAIAEAWKAQEYSDVILAVVLIIMIVGIVGMFCFFLLALVASAVVSFVGWIKLTKDSPGEGIKRCLLFIGKVLLFAFGIYCAIYVIIAIVKIAVSVLIALFVFLIVIAAFITKMLESR